MNANPISLKLRPQKTYHNWVIRDEGGATFLFALRPAIFGATFCRVLRVLWSRTCFVGPDPFATITIAFSSYFRVDSELGTDKSVRAYMGMTLLRLPHFLNK